MKKLKTLVQAKLERPSPRSVAPTPTTTVSNSIDDMNLITDNFKNDDCSNDICRLYVYFEAIMMFYPQCMLNLARPRRTP